MPRPQVTDPTTWTVVPNQQGSRRKPPFFIAGLGGINRHGESMELLDVLASLPPSSIKLFSLMVKERDTQTNMVDLAAIRQHVNARYVDNHMPALMDCNLVRRVQRGRYMINPVAIMPPDLNAARVVYRGLSREKGEAATPVTG